MAGAPTTFVSLTWYARWPPSANRNRTSCSSCCRSTASWASQQAPSFGRTLLSGALSPPF
ncbi:UNVERIFIED_CONTAM: hypothetical protein Sradi_6942500 [Sesamum radiatum]|uniref:Uncharacterized protein n=1 Tax=Sesamum radiatum TaxID=300843 RepID=A0AAW2JGH9_SESRA